MNILALRIGSEISLKNFSFSQLILAVKELFDTQGVPGFIGALIELIEALLLKSHVECPDCQFDRFHQHGKQSRKLKTSIGEVNLNLSRVKCLKCMKVFLPFNMLLDVDPYSRKSREFEKLSLETVTNQSFRRSAVNLEDTLGFKTSHTTIHRWFGKSDAIHMDVKKKVDFLISDGTGFRKDKDKEGSNRGEIKIVIGYSRNGEVVPFGAWTRASWKDIGSYIKSKNHPSKKIKFNPIANTLITDGEEEIVRRMKKLAHSHQRCLFHMTHELTPLLRYKDIVNKEEAIKISSKLNDLLYLEIPEKDADPLKSLEDKLKIEVKLKEMKKAIDEFIEELKILGYSKAKTFVENAKEQLFTYIDNWIKTGVTNPKVTSLVERTMREIKRRIKKIGFKWSEKGAEKMVRLVLLQLSSTKSYWQNHWNSKMGLDAEIKLSFFGVTVER